MQSNPSEFLWKNIKVLKELSPQSIEANFLAALKDLRTTIKTGCLNPESKAVVLESCKIINKNFTDEEFNSWLQLKCQDLFTWNDYSCAWYKMHATQPDFDEWEAKIAKGEFYVDEMGLLPTWAISFQICMAYYQFNEIYKIEEEEEFFKHPPYDYTRPHNWEKEPDFFSFGEAINAVIDLANKKGKSYLHMKLLEQFAQTHAPFFPKQPTKLEDLIIPYEYYLQCHKNCQNPSNIKPWSIEICCYYVQQNGLHPKYIYEEEAPANHDKRTSFCYYYCPSFKFFDIFDLSRFISTWTMFLGHFEAKHNMKGMRLKDFFNHCTYFKFVKFPGEAEDAKAPTDKLFWYGIYQDDQNQHWTYRQKFNQTISFLGDVVNALSYSLLLEGQVVICSPPKVGFTEISPIQKSILKPVLDKYKKVRNWLETQQQNKNRTQIQKPAWQECDAEQLLCMVSYLPRSEELHSLEKILSTSVTQEPKTSMVYQITVNILARNLSNSDITLVTKDSNNLSRAVHGLVSLGNSKPYCYHHLLGAPIKPKLNVKSNIPDILKEFQEEKVDKQFTAKEESAIY